MELKVGDVVMLKSGGPQMTIVEIGKYNYSDSVQAKCVWFERTKKTEEVFVLESLKLQE